MERIAVARNRARDFRRRNPRVTIIILFAFACGAVVALYYGSRRFTTADTDAMRSATSTPSDQTVETPTREDGKGDDVSSGTPDANANVAVVMPSPISSPAPADTPNPFEEYNALMRRAEETVTSSAASSSESSVALVIDDANRLLIPVLGITKEQLVDTFTASRSEGRVHSSIDIIAARGTPVLAATDGRMLRTFTSAKGGLTIYQMSTDERTVYYYAHLDRYADGLTDGQMLKRGQTIGYVGDTGNATPGNYHLHFSVWVVKDPKRYYDGDNINPYPLLTR